MTNKKLRKLQTFEKYFVAIAVVVLTAGIYGLWASGVGHPGKSKTKADSCALTAILVDPCRPLIGAVAGGYPQVSSDAVSQLNYFNKRLNDPNALTDPSLLPTLTYRIDVAHMYHPPGTNLFSKSSLAVINSNVTPYDYVNWKPLPAGYAWADANGSNATVNDYIKAGADAVKALGSKKIFLTVWHEAENDVSVPDPGTTACTTFKGNQGSPSDYVAMWHNVRAIFDQEGVTNVVWVMNYMGYSNWNCLVTQMWPGNSYVDWVTFDPYGNSSGTFAKSVGNLYNYLSQNNDATHDFASKPWGLAESGYSSPAGSANLTDTAALQYWQDAGTAITANTFPKLKMYMVYDTNANTAYSQVGLNLTGGVDTVKQTSYNNFAAAVFAKGASTTPPTDTTAPTVSVAAPSNGSTVSKIVTITANASDNVAVTSVKIYVDSTLIKNDVDGSDGWFSQYDTTSIANGAHTFKVVAYDAAGNSAAATTSVVVSNASAPTINSFSASPVSIAAGGTSTLSWSSANATSCAVTPGGPTGTGTSWQTGALSATTTFKLTCSNSAGSVSSSAVVTVVPAPAITSFTAVPDTLPVSNTSTLSWTTTNTSTCSITPNGPTNTTATSWQTLGLIGPGVKVFTLTCSNGVGQSTSKTVNVTVQSATVPPSSVVLTASSTAIVAGGNVTLRWTSIGGTSCTLNPGNFKAAEGSGSKTITNLRSTTTYKVTCYNGAGSTTSNSVKVSVSASNPPTQAAPVITNFVASPATIASGGTSTLTWSASNVVTDGCNLSPSPLTSAAASGQWTTPKLVSSMSYTLTCKNGSSATVSKSVSVVVANLVAPSPPPAVTATAIDPGAGVTSASGATTATVTATTGQTVVDTQATGTVTKGALATLSPSNVTDPAKVDSIVKVEYYTGQKLVYAATTAPFALDTSVLKAGTTYTITQRTYYSDGSMSQVSQLVTINAATVAFLAQAASIPLVVSVVAAVTGLFFGTRFLLIRQARQRVEMQHHFPTDIDLDSDKHDDHTFVG
ncbi:MAG TPA: Ig-like domain-containing protein [Patescibacteria group bacterium]|nr:Ig-like domain-containing protein [Patescibacteria group bacterium]